MHATLRMHECMHASMCFVDDTCCYDYYYCVCHLPHAAWMHATLRMHECMHASMCFVDYTGCCDHYYCVCHPTFAAWASFNAEHPEKKPRETKTKRKPIDKSSIQVRLYIYDKCYYYGVCHPTIRSMSFNVITHKHSQHKEENQKGNQHRKETYLCTKFNSLDHTIPGCTGREGRGVGGGRVLIVMHRRRRTTIDPGIPTMPGRITPGLVGVGGGRKKRQTNSTTKNGMC